MPGLPETRSSELFVVPSHGGKSDPSLVISNREGRAAVVFQQLVPFARDLISSGQLAYVSNRVSSGRGDYQVFSLHDRTCFLATRGTYNRPYIRLSPAATRLVVHEAIRRQQFPLVLGTVTRINTRIEILFESKEGRRRRALVTSPDGTAWFSNTPGEKVHSSEICPDMRSLRNIAKDLRKRVASESR